MNLTGSIFVNGEVNFNGYVGFIFGYQSNRRFYAVLWRNDHRNGGHDFTHTGQKGLQIKVGEFII